MASAVELLRRIKDIFSGNAEATSKTAFGESAVAQLEIHAGWSFSYNINPAQVRSFEFNGGTVTHSGSFAVMTTGTDPAGQAFIRTDDSLTYTPGIGAVVRFTAVFDTPQPDSFQLIGLGTDQDGWFFGYVGTDFGIVRRKGGVDEFIPQTDWNINRVEALDQTKGNVYQIRFQWLGFGMQYFAIENPENGNLEDVHRIRYSNQNTDVSVDIPSLPLSAGVVNTGNTTSITLRTPSAMAGTMGESFPRPFSVPVSHAREFAVVAGTQYIWGIRNPTTYLGKDNRLYAKGLLLSLTNESSLPMIFIAKFNPTITGAVWTDIQPGISPLQYDESATSIGSDGIEFFRVIIGSSDSQIIDIGNALDALLWADNTITLEAVVLVDGALGASLTLESRI